MCWDHGVGTKGSRATETGRAAAESLVRRLQPLGAVTTRTIFGGHGIFHDDVMFAMVDAQGACLLRASGASRHRFEARGSHRHGTMPYWRVPADVLADDVELLTWSGEALDVARRAQEGSHGAP